MDHASVHNSVFQIFRARSHIIQTIKIDFIYKTCQYFNYKVTFLHMFGSFRRLAHSMAANLPYFTRGKVVKGFGRGSKELGIPTANYPEDVVDKLPAALLTGVYYGWASVDGGHVHKMCMSIGWNPYYKNEKKSMETHVMHKFKDDFYGSTLSIAIVGYVRPEKSFKSLDSLILAIKSDIAEAELQLDKPELLKIKEDNFFKETS